MWRSLFLATGIVLCILGAECLILEKAVLARKSAATMESGPLLGSTATPAIQEVKPPEWAPWSLLSGGVVVILYSYSIPRRNS